MLSVSYALNRLVGPFFTGVCLAGLVSTDKPLVAVLLSVGMMICAWVSLPGSYRRIQKIVDRSS